MMQARLPEPTSYSTLTRPVHYNVLLPTCPGFDPSVVTDASKFPPLPSPGQACKSCIALLPQHVSGCAACLAASLRRQAHAATANGASVSASCIVGCTDCSHSSALLPSTSGGVAYGAIEVQLPGGRLGRGVIRPTDLIPTAPPCLCPNGAHVVGSSACSHLCICGDPWNSGSPVPAHLGHETELITECETRIVNLHYLRCTNPRCSRVLKYDGVHDGILMLSSRVAIVEAVLHFIEVMRAHGVTIDGATTVLKEMHREHLPRRTSASTADLLSRRPSSDTGSPPLQSGDRPDAPAVNALFTDTALDRSAVSGSTALHVAQGDESPLPVVSERPRADAAAPPPDFTARSVVSATGAGAPAAPLASAVTAADIAPSLVPPIAHSGSAPFAAAAPSALAATAAAFDRAPIRSAMHPSPPSQSPANALDAVKRLHSDTVGRALAAHARLRSPDDSGMMCPCCGDDPANFDVTVGDGLSAGQAARMAAYLEQDKRSVLKWHLAGAEPHEQFFIVGAVGMREINKLLYRFVRQPGTRGKNAPKAPADEPSLHLRELKSLISLLRNADAKPIVKERMNALADIFQFLLDSVPETKQMDGRFRCPESWAHFLYPVCMPSTQFVCHDPETQATILRQAMLPGAFESASGEALRATAERSSPWLIAFVDACGFSEFPPVRRRHSS